MKWLCRLWRQVTLWTSLRAVGNSTAVKLTIVIPLVGYLILFNENLLHYIELSRELFGRDAASGTIVAHVSPRLLSLYFGLCLIAVASAIHQVLCPAIVKKYASPVEYIAQEQGHISDRRFDRIEEELVENPDSAAEMEVLRVSNSRRPTPPTVEEFRLRLSRTRTEILDLQYRTLDISHPLPRRAATILYVLGFAALVVPSLEVFGRVSALLTRSAVSLLVQ